MDTLLSFYFVTGLIWSTYWTAHFAISGIQSLPFKGKRNDGSFRPTTE